MEEIAISKFKATCLAVLKRVKKSGRPIVVTKRGEPIAQIMPPPRPKKRTSSFGCMAGTIEILGDIIEPVPQDWEAMQ